MRRILLGNPIRTLFLAVPVAAMFTGCSGYIRPCCNPCSTPSFSSGGYADSGSSGTFNDDDWNEGGKTRFSGEAKYMLDTVYFDYDQSRIRPDQAVALERNLAWARQNPEARFRIEGHCDERGTEEYNLALGDRRADVVRSWMIKRGVDPSKMQTVSKGELEPVDFGRGESAWAQNRRAEFLVLE